MKKYLEVPIYAFFIIILLPFFIIAMIGLLIQDFIEKKRKSGKYMYKHNGYGDSTEDSCPDQ